VGQFSSLRNEAAEYSTYPAPHHTDIAVNEKPPT